jgi:hypothetical protein
MRRRTADRNAMRFGMRRRTAKRNAMRLAVPASTAAGMAMWFRRLRRNRRSSCHEIGFELAPSSSVVAKSRPVFQNNTGPDGRY